ncbi:MAG TPA: SRPBCC domain-containing protein [Caulobacteraceae bacterium]|nr:SRPBCC domain-containing protein [Caulobacteraceae bacterium]
MTSLVLVRRIAARPSIVFDALTTVDGVAAWWGPDDLPLVRAEIDARVGGAFRVRFRTLDGQEHEAFGEYLEVVRPERLAMSWRYAFGGEPEELGRTSRIEIALKPVDTGTELTFTHAELSNEASRMSHERGWTGSLAKLARLLANTGKGDSR